MTTKGSLLIALATLTIATVSCTVQETPAPELAGPSELALSLVPQAVPDVVTQDGQSQSAVTVDARGPSNQPIRGLAMRVDMLVNGARGDFGTLSSRTIVTGDDGRARVTYTAPPEASSPEDQGSLITLLFTPIGNDYAGAVARSVDIRLIPRGVILPPNRVAARFTYSPTAITAFQTVRFDASTSTDNLIVCGDRCAYQWSFGDGGTASGQTASHQYRSAGTFVVTLRVANSQGQSAQTSQSLTVAAGTPPTASFTFSPTAPGVQQDVFFNAEASRAAAGSARFLLSYDWNFGDGRTASGVTTSHRFGSAGSYNVTLTVTDDAGQQGTTTQTVAVGAPGTGLVANLIFSPTNPTTSSTIFFDARGSRGPSPIVRYQFDFGGPTLPPGSDPDNTSGVTSRTFTAPGSYVVRVTVYDSQNRSATTTVNVTVAP